MLQLRKILLSKYLYYSIFLLTILLTIIRLSIPYNSSYSEKSKSFTGVITNIVIKDDKTSLTITNKESVIVNYYKKIKVNLGDKVKITGLFYKPNKNTHKALFNYQEYLKRKKIFYLIKGKKIKIISKNKNPYYSIKQSIRNHFHNNPYLYTFILGDKSKIDDNVLKSYQENGISHLFAISGMHITLLASIIHKFLKKISVDDNTVYKITSLVLLLYLFLVGFTPSIVRGVLFYLLFKMNSIYYFYIKPIHLFILILSISLIINPNYIFDIGFQYSYTISFSLIILSDVINSNNYFISLLKVSIISLIISIPINLYHFYQLNIISIIYNMLYVPLISFIIFPLSLIVGLFPKLNFIYSYITSLLEKSSLFLSNIKIGIIVFKKLSIYIYIIYFLLLIIFLLYKKIKVLYILLLLLIIHYNIPLIDKTKYISYIDVGQGDSTLIQNIKTTILIDTGGSRFNSIAINTLIPIFKSNGLDRINYLILTHGDFDHMGEAINLVNNFKVEKVIFNCGTYNDLEKELIKVLDKKKIKYYSCIKELNIDNNKLYFLQTREYDNENDNSNVIYTELDGYKFMFMGDAGVEKEKDILEKYNLSDIDVLKVGHHGSKTSSGKEFIDKIDSKYSIISVGKNNRYGHPNKEVLNNLNDTKIYRTDKDGSIMFKIKNNKLKIETCSP